MRPLVVALLIAASTQAHADDFDVTMSVVDVDESFDESVVHHIKLPFGDVAAGLTDASRAGPERLERLEQLLRQQSGHEPRGRDTRSLRF